MRSATWNVDEGQRIGEAYFLRLLVDGDFDHPDWFRFITDSSHPQMSKYFFGVALRAQGVEPPRDLALPRYYESGGLVTAGWQPPPHLIGVYEPMLRPSRRAALLCNVISWMAITWLLLRWYGTGAALIAALIFARHYLPVTLMVHARSDALQACAFTLTLLPLAALWRAPRRRSAVVLAICVGVVTAIAFQTRLNGLLALGGAGVVMMAMAYRDRSRRPLGLLLVAALVCAAVALLSNPYYWAKPLPAPGLPSAYLVDEPLPFRIVHRFHTQVTDLRILLDHHAYAALPSPIERVRFVAGVLFSGAAGVLLLCGIAAGSVLLIQKEARRLLAWPALWGISTIGVFALWLPLAWDVYVMMIFPSAVLFGASGWHALAMAVVNRPASEKSRS